MEHTITISLKDNKLSLDVSEGLMPLEALRMLNTSTSIILEDVNKPVEDVTIESE